MGFQNCGKLSNTGELVAPVENNSASLEQAPMPSLNGATIPSLSQLYDSKLNLWTVVGGVVYQNGATAGFTDGVILLLYYNGLIYQENYNYKWWSWQNNSWVASSTDPRL